MNIIEFEYDGIYVWKVVGEKYHLLSKTKKKMKNFKTYRRK